MNISDLISRLQAIQEENGDIPMGFTVLDSTGQQESRFGQDLVAIELSDDGGGIYCDIVTETDAAYRIERESEKKDA